MQKIDLRSNAPGATETIGVNGATEMLSAVGLHPFRVIASNGDTLPAPQEDRFGNSNGLQGAGDSIYWMANETPITLATQSIRPGKFDGQRLRISPLSAAVVFPVGSVRGTASAPATVSPGEDRTLVWDATARAWALSGGGGSGGGGGGGQGSPIVFGRANNLSQNTYLRGAGNVQGSGTSGYPVPAGGKITKVLIRASRSATIAGNDTPIDILLNGTVIGSTVLPADGSGAPVAVTQVLDVAIPDAGGGISALTVRSGAYQNTGNRPQNVTAAIWTEDA